MRLVRALLTCVFVSACGAGEVADLHSDASRAPDGADVPDAADVRCESVTCSGHGQCVAGACSCEPGYAGETCAQCAPGFVPSGSECVPGVNILWKADPARPPLFDFDAMIGGNNAVGRVDQINDSTLGRPVMDWVLPDDGDGDSYTGFRLIINGGQGDVVNAGIADARVVYCQMLIRYGEPGEIFWERDPNYGREIKFPNISAGGSSRVIAKHWPGVPGDPGGHSRFNLYASDNATNNLAPDSAPAAGTWYWLMWQLEKTGPAATDTRVRVWHAPYTGRGDEYDEAAPQYESAPSGAYWVATDWRDSPTDSDWEFMYRGVRFFDQGIPVTRHVYVAQIVVATSFVPPAWY